MHIKGILLAVALTAPATLAMLPPTAHAVDGTLVGQPTPRLELTLTSKK